jgi:hypothetical protein
LFAGGPAGNERLTATTAALLLVLLAIEGATIVFIGRLLGMHMFVGLLLIPPVLLKMGSTGYRFVRYYTGSAPYRAKGPPVLVLRVIAPMVVATTAAVLASGVALMFAGPADRSTLLPIHKITFFVWLGFTGIHVLGHLPALAPLFRSERSAGSHRLEGQAGRDLALLASLMAGIVLAILLIPRFAAWLG